MKRLFIVTLIAGMLFGMTNVKAMTESDLRAKFDQTITVDSKHYVLKDSVMALVDKYLAQNEVSSEDADYIAKKIELAIDLLQKDGNVKPEKLSKATKDALRQIVKDVSAETKIKGDIVGNALVIKNIDGTEFTRVTDPIKQTGSETSSIAIIAGISFIITAVGACLVVRQVKTSK